MFVGICLFSLVWAGEGEVPPEAVAAPEAPPPQALLEPVPAPPTAAEGLAQLNEAERAAYDEGRRVGVEAARERVFVGPAVLAGAIGLGLSAPAVLLIGPCCGAPIVSLAAFTPGAMVGTLAPEEALAAPPGATAYDLGYAQGLTEGTMHRKSTTMLVFGAVGAAAGVGVGMVTTKLLLDEWGYTW